MSVSLRALDPAELDAAAALLAAACAFDPAGEVAADLLFGPGPSAAAAAIGAFARAPGAQGEALVGVTATSAQWIRVLAVHPDARRRGVGSALLAAAEQAVLIGAGRGAVATPAPAARRVRLLDQPGCYLAPGVDVRNADTIAWLERRGYRRAGERTNLLVDVRDNPRARPAHAAALAARCAAAGYSCRRATPEDAPALIAHVRDAYGEAWAFEVERAITACPPGVHVAIVGAAPGDGRGESAGAAGTPASGAPDASASHPAALTAAAVVAFAAHDGNNRGLGWFGPAGTAPAHRGRGLGEALLAACLCDVAAAGHQRCEIAWIGPRGFYERAAGVAGERRFVAMVKEL